MTQWGRRGNLQVGEGRRSNPGSPLGVRAATVRERLSLPKRYPRATEWVLCGDSALTSIHNESARLSHGPTRAWCAIALCPPRVTLREAERTRRVSWPHPYRCRSLTPPIPKHSTAREGGAPFHHHLISPVSALSPCACRLTSPLAPDHEEPAPKRSMRGVTAGVLPPPCSFRSRRRRILVPPQGCRRLRQATLQGDRLCCARPSVLTVVWIVLPLRLRSLFPSGRC
jgi:hypothetical protein